MKKIALIIIIAFSLIDLSGQEIDREYNYMKLDASTLKKIRYKLTFKKVYNYTDKVVLYSDSSYYRRIFGTDGLWISYEEKGSWSENKDSLILHMNKFIIPESDSTWTQYDRFDKFVKKKNKILPVYKEQLVREQKYKLKK